MPRMHVIIRSDGGRVGGPHGYAQLSTGISTFLSHVDLFSHHACPPEGFRCCGGLAYIEIVLGVKSPERGSTYTPALLYTG